MMLLATPYFWERDGKSYFNESSNLCLEVTTHAFKRAKERNVRLDSILALAEMCGKSDSIRTLDSDVFYIRYLGAKELDNILIPFSVKHLVSGDMVLYVKTVWRYLNENDDFYYREGQPIFELNFLKSGEAAITEIDPSLVLKNYKSR